MIDTTFVDDSGFQEVATMQKIKELINELQKLEIETPIFINTDDEYFKKIKQLYNKIDVVAKHYGAIFLCEEIKIIIEIIKRYYSGDIDEAIQKFNELIKKLAESNYLCAAINESEALKDFRFLKKEKNESDVDFLRQQVDFYRARVGENEVFNKEDMFHIPYNMREKVNTERFSIPGMPCLYLGKSVYICWVELGKPNDSQFYVSRIHVNDDIKIFNLVVNISKIKKLSESKQQDVNKFDICLDDLLEKYLEVWLISIACSFVVNQKERKFKSEYIIPQLLMLCLRKNGINGVAYYSKQLPEYSPYQNFAPISVNVAILADDSNLVEKDNNFYSEVINKLEVTDPVNKAEFQNITSSRISIYGTSDNIPLGNSHMHISKHIEIGGKWIEYQETRFADIERYLGK